MGAPPAEKARAHFVMLLRALVLGASFTFVKNVAEHGAPLLLTTLRFTVAAAALFPILPRAAKANPHRTGFWLYVALGLCQAVFYAGMFWAAHQLSAVMMAVITVTVPFLSYCLGLPFKVERASAPLLGILALGAGGALGLVWAQSAGSAARFTPGPADLVYFAGCIGLALYAVLTRWGLSAEYLSANAAVRSFWSIVAGGAILAVVGLATEPVQAVRAFTASDLLWLVYLGAVSTAGTVLLLQRAAPVLTPATTMAYSFAPPFVSVIALFITTPEAISWRWLPGSSLIVVAMALLIVRDLRDAC